MKTLKNDNSRGFTLLELMVAVAVMGALASIAIPQYAAYRGKVQAVHCLANRYNIEMEERAYFLDHNTPGLEIDPMYKCPCGGEYVWLISDPNDPGYPKVGCSIHYAQLSSSTEGEALFSSDFDNMDSLTPLRGKWEILNNNLAVIGRGEHRLAFGDETWTDYELMTNATLSGGQGYGIY